MPATTCSPASICTNSLTIDAWNIQKACALYINQMQEQRWSFKKQFRGSASLMKYRTTVHCCWSNHPRSEKVIRTCTNHILCSDCKVTGSIRVAKQSLGSINNFQRTRSVLIVLNVVAIQDGRKPVHINKQILYCIVYLCIHLCRDSGDPTQTELGGLSPAVDY